jgi:hypothetical protein
MPRRKNASPPEEIELTMGSAEEAPGDADASDRLLAMVSSAAPLPHDEAAIPARIAGIVIGRLVSRVPLIEAWAGAVGGAPARTLAALPADAVGREVALMFEDQDPSRPFVTGCVEPLRLPAPAAGADEGPANGLSVEANGTKERLVLSSEQELVLRCGKASITLTRAGKILIRGAYVSSTASGTNRIRGGSVDIN